MERTDKNFVLRAVGDRPDDAHKGTMGTLLSVCGSYGMAGAAVLSSLAALRSGVGLLKCALPRSVYPIAACRVPESVYLPLRENCDGKTAADNADFLLAQDADALLMGCGLSVCDDTRALVRRLLLSFERPMLLDADALTILANWYARKSRPFPVTDGQSLVLTPHAGEAARLLDCTPDDVLADRPSALRRIAERYHAVVVLKGPHTLVGAPGQDSLFTCEAGNPFMAMGGMGDLLSGVIAARWARLARSGRDDALLAASASAWLHATASDSIVLADPPGDPSIVNTARAVASIRVSLER